MGIKAIYEVVYGFSWPEKENADVKALVTKIYNYKNSAGFKNDTLGLTKRDREIIKQMYDSFETEEDKQ
jgi:hypothetical protein